MKIFFMQEQPRKNYAGKLFWIQKPNWAVEIDGQNYFGAKYKEDLEKQYDYIPATRNYNS